MESTVAILRIYMRPHNEQAGNSVPPSVRAGGGDVDGAPLRHEEAFHMGTLSGRYFD